jgi:hypothetical protein
MYQDGASAPSYAAIVAPDGNDYWWLDVSNDGTAAASHAKRLSKGLTDNSAISLP